MIRNVTANDKDVFIDLAKQFYSTDAVLSPIPDENFENTFREIMQSDVYAEGFMIESNGKTAGYALIAKTFSQEAGGLVIWIEELFILPEFQGKGLGKEFFDWLFENRPAKRYRLEIEPENEKAIGLYIKKGFIDLPYGQMVRDV